MHQRQTGENYKICDSYIRSGGTEFQPKSTF